MSNEVTVATKLAQPGAVADAPVLVVDDGLRQELGNSADSSVALVNDLLSIAPPDVATELQRSGIFRNSNVVRWVVSMLTSEEDPIVAGAGVEEEIAHIEQVLRTDRRRYNADLQMQARYRTLLASR